MKRQSSIPQRNITPNFIRFKCTDCQNYRTTQNKNQNNGISERSVSRTSRNSFQVYQKRILNLKANINLKKKVSGCDSVAKRVIDLGRVRRSPSIDKDGFERENVITLTQRANDNFVYRKKSVSNSGNGNKQSRDKNSNEKYENSLNKQEKKGKIINRELINNLIITQNTQTYLNKLKQKKNENVERRKMLKKKILDCNVEIKNEEILKFYEIFGQLGKGAYGTVCMGIDKRTGQKVAVKVYQKKRLDEINKIKNLQREINILSILNHPVIAKLIETIQTQNQIYLILEYGGANSLYNYLLSKPEHRLEQKQAQQFFGIIGETLRYLHLQNIVHRDIKAQNILINRHKQLKLIDFGFSLQSVPPDTIDTFCGTPTYMAPEIVSKKDHVPIYTDMWSMGILFYVMLQGNYPFRAKSQSELFQKIKQGHFEYIYEDISNKNRRKIESLLKIDPLQRLTAQDLLSVSQKQEHKKN